MEFRAAADLIAIATIVMLSGVWVGRRFRWAGVFVIWCGAGLWIYGAVAPWVSQ